MSMVVVVTAIRTEVGLRNSVMLSMIMVIRSAVISAGMNVTAVKKRAGRLFIFQNFVSINQLHADIFSKIGLFRMLPFLRVVVYRTSIKW